MLKLIKPQNDELARPCSNQSSGSSAISSSDWRKIRALLQEVTHEAEAKKVNKMEHTILTLTTQNTLLKTENEGLKQTIYAEKKRRKRGKGLFEQLRAQDGQGGLFMSPNKVQQALQLQAQKEEEKRQQQATKDVAKQEREQKKQEREEERLRKRLLRQEQQAKKSADQALAKAEKELSKNNTKATAQLNNEYQASLKKPKRQKQVTIAPLPLPVFHNIEVDAGPSNPASNRPSRNRRAPRHLDGYQLDS
jgi:hypothetical protein